MDNFENAMLAQGKGTNTVKTQDHWVCVATVCRVVKRITSVSGTCKYLAAVKYELSHPTLFI